MSSERWSLRLICSQKPSFTFSRQVTSSRYTDDVSYLQQWQGSVYKTLNSTDRMATVLVVDFCQVSQVFKQSASFILAMNVIQRPYPVIFFMVPTVECLRFIVEYKVSAESEKVLKVCLWSVHTSTIYDITVWRPIMVEHSVESRWLQFTWTGNELKLKWKTFAYEIFYEGEEKLAILKI